MCMQVWRARVREKLEYLGRSGARIPVGGQAPGDENIDATDVTPKFKEKPREKAGLAQLVLV